MQFADVTFKERNAFLSQTRQSLIPGYTGHCPTLKFRFGRPYGANTKEVMRELAAKGVVKNATYLPYRADDVGRPDLNHADIQGQYDTHAGTNNNNHKGYRYILGYTGYIPGLNFQYGKSFGRAADDSMTEFDTRMTEHRRRRDQDRAHRARSAPRIPSIRQRDDVNRMLHEYESKNRFKERRISPEFPPIAGYTGHIPRMQNNETSLSERFHNAAQRGLTQLWREREARGHINKDGTQIADQLVPIQNKDYSRGRD